MEKQLVVNQKVVRKLMHSPWAEAVTEVKTSTVATDEVVRKFVRKQRGRADEDCTVNPTRQVFVHSERIHAAEGGHETTVELPD